LIEEAKSGNQWNQRGKKKGESEFLWSNLKQDQFLRLGKDTCQDPRKRRCGKTKIRAPEGITFVGKWLGTPRGSGKKNDRESVGNSKGNDCGGRDALFLPRGDRSVLELRIRQQQQRRRDQFPSKAVRKGGKKHSARNRHIV